MTAGASQIVAFYLVTHTYLTSGILLSKVTTVQQPMAITQSSQITHQPDWSRTFSYSSHQAGHSNQKIDNNGNSDQTLRTTLVEPQVGYLYLKPSNIAFQLPLRDSSNLPFNKERYSKSMHGNGAASSTTSTIRPGSEVEHDPEVPRRSSYQVVEELDEYVTDDSNQGRLGHRGKAQLSYPHRDSQDLTTAIKALDHFLSDLLNSQSYNNVLHPPTNPVLALILSRYGRYVPGTRKPRVYAHMTINNIHNNQPFGKYKQECDE